MTLHIIQSSPFATKNLDQCLNQAASQDTLVLVCDGVYGTATLNQLTTKLTFYALKEDAIARGIAIDDSAKWISYAQFVELTAAHSTVMNWG